MNVWPLVCFEGPAPSAKRLAEKGPGAEGLLSANAPRHLYFKFARRNISLSSRMQRQACPFHCPSRLRDQRGRLISCSRQPTRFAATLSNALRLSRVNLRANVTEVGHSVVIQNLLLTFALAPPRYIDSFRQPEPNDSCKNKADRCEAHYRCQTKCVRHWCGDEWCGHANDPAPVID